MYKKPRKSTNSATLYKVKTGHLSLLSLSRNTTKHTDNSMDSMTDDRQGIELYMKLSEHWKGAGM